MNRSPHSFPALATALTPSAIGHLRAWPLFEGLEAPAMARIVDGSHEIGAASGAVIFQQGDPCQGLYIVIAGEVKLTLRAPQGSEKVIELVGTGGVFGESAIFLDRSHVLTATTLAATRLVRIGKAVVLAELERTPRFTRAMVASLSHRMGHLIGALEDCMLRSGAERVMGYLLNRVPPDAVNGNTIVTLPTKKGIIAAQLNLTHEHFSRILRDLVTDGLIEVDGREVRLPDLARLHARLNGAA